MQDRQRRWIHQCASSWSWKPTISGNRSLASLFCILTKTVYVWAITLTTSIKETVYTWDITSAISIKKDGLCMSPYISYLIKKDCLSTHETLHQPLNSRKAVYVWAITSTTMYFNQERLSMYVWAITSTTSIKKNCLCMSHYNNYFSQVRLSTHRTLHQTLQSRKTVYTWDITSNTSIKKDRLSMSH